MVPRPQDLLRRSTAEAGWNDVDSIDPDLLGADDETVRGTALAALARSRRLSIPQLVAALADGAPRVRMRAMRLAVERWDDEVAAQVDLTQLLADDDDAVVETACFLAGECAGPEPAVVDALATIARGHRDPLCRESATAALGAIIARLDDTGVASGPESATDHSRATDHSGVGGVVGVALEAVLHACADRATVRRRAVLALAAFDDPRATEQLHRALDDVDWQVRQAAEDLLDDEPLDDEPLDDEPRQTRASMNITLSDS